MTTQHPNTPEYDRFEAGIEVRTENSEQVEKLHAIEYLVTKITESGPELDPEYLEYLKGLLQSAIDDLNEFLSDNAADISEVIAAVEDARSRLDDEHGVEISRIMASLSLPASMREVVESVLVGRAEGRAYISIYRQLARTYHPDQTQIDPSDAEELFKLIGQLIWDENSRDFVF